MDAAAGIGRNSVSKHQIQPSVGNEQADAGRDGRTRLARPKSVREWEHGNFIFPVQLTTSRIGNLRPLLTLLKKWYQKTAFLIINFPTGFSQAPVLILSK